jgi:hypothetical protein
MSGKEPAKAPTARSGRIRRGRNFFMIGKIAHNGLMSHYQ